MLRQLAISVLLLSTALPAAARTRPHYGGTLRVEMEGNPLQHPDGIARKLLLDGLTRLDAQGTVQPALAIRWTSESNNHRWQFWLRPGVHFHNGAALNATAAIAALNAICGSGCPWTTVQPAGASIVFTSESPMPNLDSLLAEDAYLIYLNDTGDGRTQTCCVGTGPFELPQTSSSVFALIANDSYWQGRPFIDKIEIIAHKSIHDQGLDLTLGRADLVEVPAEQIRQARDQRLTVVTSQPTELIALAVTDSGVLGNPALRTSIALAVDRAALSNVIFQKQGEITASLLPASLTGYSFLFSIDRDVNKARELRGGISSPQLLLSTEVNPTMQLAAQRIALNLREAGFNVQVAAPPQHSDMMLVRLTLAPRQPQAALASMLRGIGVQSPVLEDQPAGLYRVEYEFLDAHTLIPLLYLPRAYAVGGRVRDLRLASDGTPLLANVALEDAPDATGAAQ